MPSARSATTAPRSRSPDHAAGSRPPAAKPRRVASRSAVTRARWERLGRVTLLVVLTAVVVLYGEHAVSYLSTRSANERQQATVRALEVRHAALLAEQRSLSEPVTIVREARALGMTRRGEQPYDVTGQPSR